jgi:Alpha amylase, catalytic domain
MGTWPRYPTIYEINTWVWLQDLSQKYKEPVTLATVPAKEWDAIANLGVDAVWLMGVWERSPASIRISMQNQGLLGDFRRALPDFSEKDNIGSAYSVRRYVVDDRLGGLKELAVARSMLDQRGIRLVLDFVPNHVATDHPWVTERPEYFIRGEADDLRRDPDSFVAAGGKVFACGRDPYFPAWRDVLQLNAFHPATRRAAVETVSWIASQCDGVRCDMAMLLMNDIFQRTWGPRAGTPPSTEYWPELIQAVRRQHPDFMFMAEVYWDLDWQLQQQGFDFCYDKKLYDRLVHETAESVRLHLCADPAYQDRLVRFIENHDESRAAATFSPQKGRAVAVAISSITGAKLLYEGQFEGRMVRVPVFLARRPPEPIDHDLQSFYQRLLKAVSNRALREGEWALCERSGWADNPSYLHLIAWCWRGAGERFLMVVNLSDWGAQARVQVPWEELKGRSWRLIDLFTGAVYGRNGEEMCQPGLFVDLPAWGFHFFKLGAE